MRTNYNKISLRPKGLFEALFLSQKKSQLTGGVVSYSIENIFRFQILFRFLKFFFDLAFVRHLSAMPGDVPLHHRSRFHFKPSDALLGARAEPGVRPKREIVVISDVGRLRARESGPDVKVFPTIRGSHTDAVIRHEVIGLRGQRVQGTQVL